MCRRVLYLASLLTLHLLPSLLSPFFSVLPISLHAVSLIRCLPSPSLPPCFSLPSLPSLPYLPALRSPSLQYSAYFLFPLLSSLTPLILLPQPHSLLTRIAALPLLFPHCLLSPLLQLMSTTSSELTGAHREIWLLPAPRSWRCGLRRLQVRSRGHRFAR